jgi:hypothetical protein
MDSAALSAARSLDGTRAGADAAHNSAYQMARQHYIDAYQVDIAANSSNAHDGDVEAGYWDGVRFYGETETVPGLGDADITLQLTATPQFFNAIRVKGGADGAANHNAQLAVFFSTFLGGAESATVHAQAIAVAGGPCTESRNILPMVVPSCAIVDGDGSTRCDQTVTLDFKAPSTVAFADLTPPSGVLDEGEAQQQLGDAHSGNSAVLTAFDHTPPSDGRVATSDGASYSSTTIDSLRALIATSSPPYSASDSYVLPIINLGAVCTTAVPARPAPIGFADVAITNVNWTATDHKISFYIRCTTACSEGPCPTAAVTPSNHPALCAHFGFGSQSPPLLVK